MAEISCTVCAYNERDRIQEILTAVHGHPMLKEVIVVDDGSTGGTAAVLQAWPSLRAVALPRSGWGPARRDWFYRLSWLVPPPINAPDGPAQDGVSGRAQRGRTSANRR